MEEHSGAQLEAPQCSVSLTEELVATLQIEGPLTMDQLLILFPGTTWWQFFEVIDSLSRSGRIVLNPTDDRDYLLSIRPANAA
ncbi:MAG TPA: hypothetical protein VJV04_12625 [Nitrospiraceae bacterium]|nr:hypothetical protein [Nitrospiraceae bacterium]